MVSLVAEFWDFMRIRKKFWLAPILMILVILSALMILSVTSPVLSSVIYPLF